MRLVISSTLAAGVLAFAPAAESRSSAILTLEVDFSYTGDITVMLPNGTPVGTKTGSPTVIPAGYYTVELTQPGCVDVPAFILQGPGVNILDDLQSGEVVTDAVEADFQPNTTYTWRNGTENPPVYFTFATSGTVLGTPPPVTPAANGPVSSNKEANGSIVGSGLVKSSASLLGTLAGGVSATGSPHLSYKGKAVSSLFAGRYKITVADTSKTSGFMLESSSHRVVSLTNQAFVGTHAATVTLTAGKWFFVAGPAGAKTSFVVVK